MNEKKLFKKVLKECISTKSDVNACLRKRGYRLEEIKQQEVKIPKFKYQKFKYPKIEVKEFNNIQNALKKLRKLRGI